MMQLIRNDTNQFLFGKLDKLLLLIALFLYSILGSSFCGALAYADDIVLIAPTPAAMRKLLCICEGYAVD